MIRSFLQELKRRRVIAVVTWYVLATWVALQVAEVLGPVFFDGDSAIRFLVWLAVLGFPLAAIFGWRYDFRGGRIERTAPAESGEHSPLGIRDYAVLAVMGIAIVGLGMFALQQVKNPPVREALGSPSSIAVLKVSDQSGAMGQLAESISDQMVTTLITNPNLTVTGRSSSFYFSDHPAELEKIAAMLNTRHLLLGELTGSESSAELKLELMEMPGQEVIWAETMPVDSERHYSIYQPLSRELATAIGVAFPGQADIIDPFNAPLEDTLQKALSMGSGNSEQRITWARRATELAPNDPRTWSALSFNLQLWLGSGRAPIVDTLEEARATLNRAAELGADGYYYHWAAGLGLRRQWRMGDTSPEVEQAFKDHMDKVIAMNPSDAVPYTTYSIFYRLQRRYQDAGVLLRTAMQRDPLYAGARMQYSRVLSALGERESAILWVTQLPALFGGYYDDVVARYLEYSQLDLAILWQNAMPAQGPNRHYWMATTWAEAKNTEMAMKELDKVDSGSHWNFRAEIMKLFLQGHADQALEYALTAIESEQHRDSALTDALMLAAHLGKHDLVIELVNKHFAPLADPLSPDVSEGNAWLAIILANALRHTGEDPVREGILSGLVLNTVRGRSFQGFDGVGDRAILVHAYRGENEKALALLQSAYEEGWRMIYRAWGNLHPAYEWLRDDPEFERILAAIDADLEEMNERALDWIAEGRDPVGPPPSELASLDDP